MGEKDRLKWDERYARDGFLYGEEPLPFIAEQAQRLPARGRALDVACGEGRNSVFLAQHGLDTVGIDISAIALRKARQLARSRGVDLEVQLWDIERSFLPEGPFDVIVCTHYKQRDLTGAITESLASGGLLLMELHTVANLQLNPHPSRTFLVEHNELLGWFPELIVESYRETELDGQAVAQLVGRKP